MKKFISKIFCLMFAIMLSSCSDDSPVINNVIPPDNSPMWPQAGFDARHTGNINAQKTYIQPVTQGQLDWSYTFPSGSYSDGSEFCIDSKGNIYFIAQTYPWGKLYKFTSGGNVIWTIDSVRSDNYAAVSLSSEEKYIYFVATRPTAFNHLFCYDSSGILNWENDSLFAGYGCKPAIGKDGTIYSLIGGLSAVDSKGKVKWVMPDVHPNSELVLDNEDNIYTNGNIIRKINKEGLLQWEFQPNSDFYTFCIVIDGYNNLYFQDYNSGNANEPKLYSLNTDGQVRWTSNLGGYYNLAITKDNKIITDGDSIRAFDTSGTELWRKSPLTPGAYNILAENIFLDGNGNIYYLSISFTDLFSCSVNSSGEIRWIYYLGQFSTLPKIALSPTGKLLFSPKRSFAIYSIK